MGLFPNFLGIRILLAFLNKDSVSGTVTGLARALGESRESVTEALLELRNQGYIDYYSRRCPRLTEEGTRKALDYQDRISVAQDHLLYDGVDPVTARAEAQIIGSYASDRMIDFFRLSRGKYQLKRDLKSREDPDAASFCRSLGNGVFMFPFVIYRSVFTTGCKSISVAQDAFLSPCSVCVREQIGTVYLQPIEIAGCTEDGKYVKNRVISVEYMKDGAFAKGNTDSEGRFGFPVEALQFVKIGAAGPQQLIHASACLRVTGSSTNQRSASEVMFTMIF